jgi:ABC-type bacteriocin/lantibiotic exporter with double-glycine peptidase domain
MENINVGRKNVNFPEVRWAVNNLGLTDFVKNLPQGYETIIDPDGKKLPRSVVQKILLARAIAGSPSLILMEDALEHIESEERKDIIDFLTDHSNKWTLITVSSDPYFARKCDRVVIMDAGKIVEEGTWDDIIDKK